MAVMITMVIMKINYVEGNSVEEYCLPFLSWSFYGILLYFKKENVCHNWKWTILYGITSGICLLTRVTNFIPLCMGILAIVILLIYKREYFNLLQNAGAFILGFVIVFVPFAIYFMSKGAFWDAAYAVIQFNIEYSAGIDPWYSYADSNAIRDFFKLFFDFYVIFIAAGIRFLRKDFKLGIVYTLTGLLEGIYFMNGYAWSQYPFICLPQVILLLNEIIHLLDKKDKSEYQFIGILLTFFIGLFIWISCNEDLVEFKNYRNAFSQHNEREWEKLVYEIPASELNSFVAYGGNEFKELYLLTNTMPCYKYYVIETWICRFSDKVTAEVCDTFYSGGAKWIITDNDTALIDDTLNSRYAVFDSTENYTLYELKYSYNQ